MKKIISIILLSVFLYADNVTLEFGFDTNNPKSDNYYKGIGFTFLEDDTNQIKLEYGNYVNQYDDNANMVMVTNIYTPLSYQLARLGVVGSFGYQKGYYVNDLAQPNATKGDDSSLFVSYGLYVELDNIYVEFVCLPNDKRVLKGGIKAVEW